MFLHLHALRCTTMAALRFFAAGSHIWFIRLSRKVQWGLRRCPWNVHQSRCQSLRSNIIWVYGFFFALTRYHSMRPWWLGAASNSAAQVQKPCVFILVGTWVLQPGSFVAAASRRQFDSWMLLEGRFGAQAQKYTDCWELACGLVGLALELITSSFRSRIKGQQLYINSGALQQTPNA